MVRFYLKAWCLALALALAASAVGSGNPALAASAAEIDADVDATITKFKGMFGSAGDLLDKAKGALIFPSIIKAGIGIGGEYGEGALRIGGKTDGYYNKAGASIGLQFGAQARTEIILFMTDEALKGFEEVKGFEIGVDGSVAVADLGASGNIDTNSIQDPIIAFVFGEKGLMANLTLEGGKITELDK